MSRAEQRRLALHFSLSTIVWLACLFAWVAVLTFRVDDWPSASVWPHNSPPHNWCGTVGSWIAYQLFYYVGLGTYPALLLLTAAIAAWTHNIRLPDVWFRFVGLSLIATATSTAAHIILPSSAAYVISGPGGILGLSTAHVLQVNLGIPGTMILIACAIIVGLLLAADEAVIRLGRWLLGIGKRSGPALLRNSGHVLATAGATIADTVSNVSGRLATAGADLASSRARKPVDSRNTAGAQQLTLELDEEDEPEDEVADEIDDYVEEEKEGDEEDEDEYENESPPPVVPKSPVTHSPRLPRHEAPAVTAAPRAPQTEYEVPPLKLLDEPEDMDRQAIELICREKAYILEQTLNEFKLEVQVAAIETGPVITVFELKLAPGIKVSQIASLTNDLARALKAPAVRVVAPLPGKNTIGIEVPNVDKEKVRLKDLIQNAPAKSNGYAIPLYLGKDASGQPLISDMTRMPHLLIAGTTGSGKSVCVASIISSIMMTRAPEDVKLILVDPKVVELALFKDIPHLMCPIVTEVSKAEGILDWAATKMDERYALLAEAGVKDIRSYNQLGESGLRERMGIEDDEELGSIPAHLPYIVIVIDELADLMMTSAKEVEFYLCRLAQKSRAVGIHLIVSTQRPQANVVTGLIKSNLPCRIAFRVSSRLDSRIVLDQNGGETLMGQGDMLFLPPGSAKLLRAQGTFMSDEELRAVVKHARAQGEPQYLPELTRMPKADGEGGGERDELFDQAVDIIIQTGRGSVSLLQRRLTVGYSRASRLIDQMYDAGIVGEYKGSQAREVLLSKEDWDAVRSTRDREEAADEYDYLDDE